MIVLYAVLVGAALLAIARCSKFSSYAFLTFSRPIRKSVVRKSTPNGSQEKVRKAQNAVMKPTWMCPNLCPWAVKILPGSARGTIEEDMARLVTLLEISARGDEPEEIAGDPSIASSFPFSSTYASTEFPSACHKNHHCK